ncbi:unnamed protein product [Caenorhabditis nigoni]
MKLLKYPRLVQDQILDYTGCSNLLLLSPLSRKVKELIKLSQTARFKNVASIVYDCDGTDPPLVYIDYGVYNSLLKFFEYDENENVQFQLDVSGKMIDFRLSDKYYCPVALFHPHERESVIESIHNHFLDFFGTSMEYHWKTNNMLSTPQLQNLSACIRMGIRREFENRTDVDNFFSSHPVLKSIKIWEDESLSPELESRLLQAESIQIYNSDRNLPAVLNFQGKQAFLDCVSIKVSDVVEFVNRWKSGETYQNLEHLKIKTFREEIPRDEILTAIGARHIDTTKKPPTHAIPKAFIEYAFEPNTDPIISHSYVVRDSDNRVASVLIQGKTLSFGVWDKTEEEFLRMVEQLQIDSYLNHHAFHKN